ncbi:MAG: tRNA 4-thiouridine(8) synthase ThiI [Planctomycetota bacterium]|nr:MAG: tRNA 4-thiouridine(8) synthase ThiI [Planctomycetota bacterium]
MNEKSEENKAVIIITYGEIALKKGRRHLFEKKLINNLQNKLRGKHYGNIRSIRGRIKITLHPQADVDLITQLCSKVFGVVAVYPAKQVSLEWDDIVQNVTEFTKEHPQKELQKTFAIKCIRPNKNYDKNSVQVGQLLGAEVLELAPSWSVDLDNPEIIIIVEIHSDSVYLATKKIKGPCGLPVGISGKLSLLLSGGIDSPVAGYLMQKRGARLVALYFHSHPYTGDQALNKVKELAINLRKNQDELSLYMIHLTEIQEAIRDKCDPRYAVILTRRFMMRLAQIYSFKKKTKGIVTGENLGQVASQTLDSMAVIEEATKLPIYRPLISFDKNEIVDISIKIETYDISIRPYEDCCSLFVDPHPVTDAKLEAVEEQESKLEVGDLVWAALKKSKRILLD